MGSSRINAEEAGVAFNAIDENSSGHILFDEFCTWAIKHKLKHDAEEDVQTQPQATTTTTEETSNQRRVDRICAEFKQHDVLGESTLTTEELASIFQELNPDLGMEQVSQLLKMSGLESKGVVN